MARNAPLVYYTETMKKLNKQLLHFTKDQLLNGDLYL